MTILGVVTTADMAAFHAEPEVNPLVSCFKALLTAFGRFRFYVANTGDMAAAVVSHCDPRLQNRSHGKNNGRKKLLGLSVPRLKSNSFSTVNSFFSVIRHRPSLHLPTDLRIRDHLRRIR
jgi:hypothetical protein